MDKEIQHVMGLQLIVLICNTCPGYGYASQMSVALIVKKAVCRNEPYK